MGKASETNDRRKLDRAIQRKADKRRKKLVLIGAAAVDALTTWAATQNDRRAIRELAQKVKDIEEGKA